MLLYILEIRRLLLCRKNFLKIRMTLIPLSNITKGICETKIGSTSSFKQQVQKKWAIQVKEDVNRAQFGFCNFGDFQTVSCYFINAKLQIISSFCAMVCLFDRFWAKKWTPCSYLACYVRKDQIPNYSSILASN